MSAIVFDIETGPREWSEIESFYQPPDEMPEWNDGMVKYGNLKDEAKRKEKFEQTKNDYAVRYARQAEENAKHRDEWHSRAALSPLTGRVLAIGLRSERGVAILGDDDQGEPAALAAFWGKYRQCCTNGRRLIGFNIFGFDLPFLIRRSWLYSVEVPSSVLEKSRYWSAFFVDLMAIWGCGIYGERGSLDTISRYFGVGGKPNGVCGGDFAGLWLGDQAARAKAVEYLENDLDMTWRLAERMGVVL